MKILAIETTGVSGSVALADDGRVILARALRPETRSAESLIPAIRSVCAEANWSVREPELIAVAVGPGSFTGLRVGVTCAKILAWGIKAKIVGVDTLEALAFQAAEAAEEIREKNRPLFPERGEKPADFVISVGLDAQRREAAVRDFLVSDGRCFPLSESFRLEPILQWLDPESLFVAAPRLNKENYSERAENFDRNVLLQENRTGEKLPRFFTGPLLQKWGEKVAPSVRSRFIPEFLREPNAASVARLGFLRAAQSEGDDPWRLIPIYSRISAAEEKLLQKRENQ